MFSQNRINVNVPVILPVVGNKALRPSNGNRSAVGAFLPGLSSTEQSSSSSGWFSASGSFFHQHSTPLPESTTEFKWTSTTCPNSVAPAHHSSATEREVACRFLSYVSCRLRFALLGALREREVRGAECSSPLLGHHRFNNGNNRSGFWGPLLFQATAKNGWLLRLSLYLPVTTMNSPPPPPLLLSSSAATGIRRHASHIGAAHRRRERRHSVLLRVSFHSLLPLSCSLRSQRALTRRFRRHAPFAAINAYFAAFFERAATRRLPRAYAFPS